MLPRRDLEIPFLLTAAVAAAVAIGAYAGGFSVWAAHFSGSAVLFTLNWYASAVVLLSIGAKRPLALIVGIQVKMILIAVVLGLLYWAGTEWTALLAGLHLYLVALLGWFAFRRFADRRLVPAVGDALALKGVRSNG